MNYPELQAIVAKMTYPNWEFECRAYSFGDGYGPGIIGRVSMLTWVEDVYSPGERGPFSASFTVSDMFSEKDVVVCAFKGIKEAAIHEVGEWFLYEGERVFNPHLPTKPNYRPEQAIIPLPDKAVRITNKSGRELKAGEMVAIINGEYVGEVTAMDLRLSDEQIKIPV